MTAPATRHPDASQDELRRAMGLLPGDPRFRFVDRILRLAPGHDGEADYRVRGDEPFLPGHFPNDPLFPGVLLLEAAAQLAVVVLRSDPRMGHAWKPTALRSIKILGTARPGETVHLEARITGRAGQAIQFQITARVGGEVAMTGDLMLGGPTH